MFRITGVVKHLLIINVLFFVASKIFDTHYLALYYFESDNFMPFQIVTHFFMHANLAHIFFNMFALVMFGSALEALWGPKRFLFFYIFCAIGAALLHTFVNYIELAPLKDALQIFQQDPSYQTFWNFFNKVNFKFFNTGFEQQVNALGEYVKTGGREASLQASNFMQQVYTLKIDSSAVVGASGAIFGLLLAFGMKFPSTKLMLIFFPVPIKAKYFIPLMMVLELYLGVNNFSWDRIAHFAHLGGALFGFLLILYWRKFDPKI